MHGAAFVRAPSPIAGRFGLVARIHSERDTCKPMQLSEVQAVASSDFEAAYRDLFVPVWRYLALSLRNRADADELAQEVFERAFRAMVAGHGPEPGLWEPWLMLAAHRLVVSRYRRRRILAWLPLVGDNHSRADTDCFGEVELNIWLDQLTALLPARQRQALFLRYVGGMDDTAVGAVLGITPSGVRSLMARAVGRLKEHQELWK